MHRLTAGHAFSPCQKIVDACVRYETYLKHCMLIIHASLSPSGISGEFGVESSCKEHPRPDRYYDGIPALYKQRFEVVGLLTPSDHCLDPTCLSLLFGFSQVIVCKSLHSGARLKYCRRAYKDSSEVRGPAEYIVCSNSTIIVLTHF